YRPTLLRCVFCAPPPAASSPLSLHDALPIWTRTCVEAWKALMNTVQEGYEAREFPVAEGVVQRSYCTQSGLLAGPGCPSRATGYYKADDLPATCNYDHSGGIVSTQVDTEGVITD